MRLLSSKTVIKQDEKARLAHQKMSALKQQRNAARAAAMRFRVWAVGFQQATDIIADKLERITKERDALRAENARLRAWGASLQRALAALTRKFQQVVESDSNRAPRAQVKRGTEERDETGGNQADPPTYW
jgi:hypothetical protein